MVEAYRQQRTYQTHEFATRAAEKYCTFGPERAAPFWELFDKLMGFVDLSDPDISLSNHQHLFQTAEGLREDGHPEWMQFVGLIHDLGKVIHLRGGCDEDGTSMATQWGIVGDTFITGCAIPDTIVFPVRPLAESFRLAVTPRGQASRSTRVPALPARRV